MFIYFYICAYADLIWDQLFLTFTHEHFSFNRTRKLKGIAETVDVFKIFCIFI